MLTVAVKSTEALKEAVREPVDRRILMYPGTYGGNIIIDGARNFTIQSVDPGHPAAIRDCAWGLKFIEGERIRVESIRVEGWSEHGIIAGPRGEPPWTLGVRGLEIRECDVIAGRSARPSCCGLKLTWIDGLVLRECTITDWPADGTGIDCVGCANGLIDRCETRTFQPATAGIMLKGGSADLHLVCNRVSVPSRFGIRIGGDTDPQFMRPEADGWEARRITATANEVDCTETAFTLREAQGCKIYSNSYGPRVVFAAKADHRPDGRARRASSFTIG